jgi:enamidase
MGETRLIRVIVSAALLVMCSVCIAQDLVITNARIIVGTGNMIENGSVVVRSGLIASVSSGETEPEGVTIDAQNMVVLPGLIDTHRHDVIDTSGQAQLPALKELLSHGVTTVMTPGGVTPEILDLRRRLAEGQIEGPRLVTSGAIFTAPGDWPVQLFTNNPEGRRKGVVEVVDTLVARNRVTELANAGVNAIKIIYDSEIVPGVRLDDRVLEAVADEAERHNLPAYVHVGGVNEMLTVVGLGADRLVHVPNVGLIEDGPGASILREKGIAIATTTTLDALAVVAAATQPELQEAEAKRDLRLRNIRHLWNEGVTVAFGTDSTSRTGPTIMTEILTLGRTLTNLEIIDALTRNGAEYLYLGDEIGTLEPGKMADLVIIDGDPLTNISDLENVVVVIQGGQIVIDNR